MRGTPHVEQDKVDRPGQGGVDVPAVRLELKQPLKVSESGYGIGGGHFGNG